MEKALASKGSYAAAEAAMQLVVVVVRRAPVLVAPLQETPEAVLALPAASVFSGAASSFGSGLSCHTLVFPRRAAGYRADGEAVRAVMGGLAQALVPYYPLAGRLRAGPQRGRLELVCNGKGAPFTEAHCNLSLPQLTSLEKAFWSDFQCPLPAQDDSQIAPLAVQVTMLACGGFVVSIRILQSLCDASGVLHFFHAWSECARGNRDISILPLWGDTPPMQHLGRTQSFHYTSLDLVARDENLYQQEMKYGRYNEGLLPIASISIPLEDLTNIKRSLSVKCNKFEALAAVFWRERTRALGLSPSSEVLLFFPAPVAHDVPVLFHGVYSFNCMVASRVADLLQNDLAYAVRLIHEAKRTIVEDFVVCARQYARVHSHMEGGPPPHVLLFSLPWEDIRDIDFGWGASPHAPDVVRMGHPINVVAVTGASEEDTLELVATNVPPQLTDGLARLLPRLRSSTYSSRL